MRSRKLVYATALVAAVFLAATGCSSANEAGGTTPSASTAAGQPGSTDILGTYAAMPASQRDAALVPLAQQEGALSLYTSFQKFGPVADAFKKKYGITVTIYQATSQDLATRVQQEGQANKPGADLLETNVTDVGTAASYIDQSLKYTGGSQLLPNSPTGPYVADRENVYATTWNTKKLADADVPNSVTDLADPKWKGKFVVEVSDGVWYAGLEQFYISQGQSADQVKAELAAVLKNAKSASGHGVTENLVESGQYELTPDELTSTTDKAAKGGAPVTYKKKDGSVVGPVILLPAVFGLVKGAAHPAAALLFVDYVLSPEGQQVLDAQAAVGATVPGSTALTGLSTFTVDGDKYLSDPSYDAEFKADLGSAG